MVREGKFIGTRTQARSRQGNGGIIQTDLTRSGYILILFLIAALMALCFVSPADSEGEIEGNVSGTVCLDPGHPSEVSSGMVVQNGVTENHINWLIAVELKGLLEQSGFEVLMTKTEEEEYVTNRERAAIANEGDADLFFRIHCDAGPENARGMTFHYPDRQGTWEGETGPPVEIIPACMDAARTIHDVATAELDGLLDDRGVKTDNDTCVGRRQGGALRGSILSEVPVVLVEVCFLSNRDDAALVKDDETRSLIVAALAEGIIAWLEKDEDDQ